MQFSDMKCAFISTIADNNFILFALPRIIIRVVFLEHTISACVHSNIKTIIARKTKLLSGHSNQLDACFVSNWGVTRCNYYR